MATLPHTLLLPLLGVCMSAAAAGVDANHASEAELDGIRGIGPDLSARILAERRRSPFLSWDDFSARVPGIGRARASKLSAQGLTVAGLPYTEQAPQPTAPIAKP